MPPQQGIGHLHRWRQSLTFSRQGCEHLDLRLNPRVVLVEDASLPDQPSRLNLEELAIGWLHGEGYIQSLDEVRLRPCTSDLGFWAEISEENIASVASEDRRSVLASGCGAVTTMLADPASATRRGAPVDPPEPEILRVLLKSLFQRGERYRDTGGIHAAALTDGTSLLTHAEDIGRHNAVDKVIGAALLERLEITGMGLLVTGRISAELAFKASRAGLGYVATPSVPSTLAGEIADRSGMTLVGRAASGTDW